MPFQSQMIFTGCTYFMLLSSCFLWPLRCSIGFPVRLGFNCAFVIVVQRSDGWSGGILPTWGWRKKFWCSSKNSGLFLRNWFDINDFIWFHEYSEVVEEPPKAAGEDCIIAFLSGQTIQLENKKEKMFMIHCYPCVDLTERRASIFQRWCQFVLGALHFDFET